MSEISKRLEKLDSDVELIRTIRDILMADENGLINLDIGNEISRNAFQNQEIPVRDSNHIQKSNRKIPAKNLVNRQKSCREIVSGNNSLNNYASEIVSSEFPEEQNENQRSDFMQKVNEERQKRIEIEDSAQRVAIQLQKVEDELTRERETKRNLLVGTLEMKNQLQSYQQQISQLESQLSTFKNEKSVLESKLKNAEQNKIKTSADIKHKMECLTMEKFILEQRNLELKTHADILKTSLDELKSDINRKEKQQKEREETLLKQIEQTVSKCNQIDKEREELSLQLQIVTSKLKTLEENNKRIQTQLQTSKGNTLEEIAEKKVKIKCLESEMKLQKERMESQIKSAVNLVTRTKSFIISLQQEKDQGLKKSQILKENNRRLSNENHHLNAKIRDLSENFLQVKQRLGAVLEDNLEKSRKFQREREKFTQDFSQIQMEKVEFSKRCDFLEKEMESHKIQFEHEKSLYESQLESLREELKRIGENYKVLQKVSEDQGRTISKQRGDLEGNSKEKFEYELKLKESLEREKALSVRLDCEERLSRDLEGQVVRLEEQIERMQDEIQEHNCQDQVDSKWISKFREMETLKSSWQNKTKQMENERDLALAAARKVLRQTEEMKQGCESRLGKLRNSTAQQISQIEGEKIQIEREKSKKIQDLESELVRMKESGMRMQRAYTNKIHQLQTALCLIGGGTSANSHINSAPYFNGLDEHLFL